MDIQSQIITAAVGLGIVGFAYLIDLIGGIVKVNTSSTIKWSWKILFTDLLKVTLAAFDTLAFVVLLNLLTWYGTQTGADLSILSSVSFPVMIAAILGGAVYYAISAGKNLLVFWNSHNVKIEIDESKMNTKAIADAATHVLALGEDWFRQFGTSKQAAEAHAKYEAEGGQGTVYSVPIANYDVFRNTVNGKAYDIDGAYGAQCWDGAALLWQQIGKYLSTGGTGAAKGCWEVVSARNANAGSDFQLISNLADVRRGDVVVLSTGKFGHIAFADQNGASVMNLLGQNQGGDGSGRAFNVMAIGMSTFIGAFRFKRWIPVVPPTPPKPVDPVVPPAPPAPADTVPNNPTAGVSINIGDTVTAWGVGTADSYGGGAKTINFPKTAMKVIGINNGRYGLNQYNAGTPGHVPDVTAWFPLSQIQK